MQYMDYKYIPFIGTSLFVLVMVALLIYLLTVKKKEQEDERNFDRQLRYSLNPEVEEEKEDSFISKKLQALPLIMIKAEMVKSTVTVRDIQRKMLLYGSLIFFILTMFSRNPIAGILPLLIAYGVIYGLAVLKINRKKNLMNEQIPAFVSIFKANIQANQHAQNAMINAINNTATPLYDELARPKSIMEAGDFRPGIVALRMSTENETLRQMASCIELASASGSNIEEQIEIIENIIEDKQLIERKKKLGVNENKPLFYVATAFIPLAFFGSYFMSDMHKEYWFSTPLSYMIIVGIIIAMAISSWATLKVIQKVDV